MHSSKKVNSLIPTILEVYNTGSISLLQPLTRSNEKKEDVIRRVDMVLTCSLTQYVTWGWGVWGKHGGSALSKGCLTKCWNPKAAGCLYICVPVPSPGCLSCTPGTI